MITDRYIWRDVHVPHLENSNDTGMEDFLSPDIRKLSGPNGSTEQYLGLISVNHMDIKKAEQYFTHLKWVKGLATDTLTWTGLKSKSSSPLITSMESNYLIHCLKLLVARFIGVNHELYAYRAMFPKDDHDMYPELNAQYTKGKMLYNSEEGDYPVDIGTLIREYLLVFISEIYNELKIRESNLLNSGCHGFSELGECAELADMFIRIEWYLYSEGFLRLIPDSKYPRGAVGIAQQLFERYVDIQYHFNEETHPLTEEQLDRIHSRMIPIWKDTDNCFNPSLAGRGLIEEANYQNNKYKQEYSNKEGFVYKSGRDMNKSFKIKQPITQEL